MNLAEALKDPLAALRAAMDAHAVSGRALADLNAQQEAAMRDVGRIANDHTIPVSEAATETATKREVVRTCDLRKPQAERDIAERGALIVGAVRAIATRLEEECGREYQTEMDAAKQAMARWVEYAMEADKGIRDLSLLRSLGFLSTRGQIGRQVRIDCSQPAESARRMIEYCDELQECGSFLAKVRLEVDRIRPKR